MKWKEKVIKKIFKEYKGDYLFINENQINYEPYKEIDQFRYLFRHSITLVETNYYDTEVIDFEIYDRKEKKSYCGNSKVSAWTWYLRKYIENLNEGIEQ
jgi:hypothetical protein